MAAIVCHGLQSHLETQLGESRTLRLRLPSPKQVTSQSIDLAFKSCFWDSNSNIKTNQEENININKTETFQQNKAIPSNPNTAGRGWSFLDALSNISQDTKQQQPSQKETTTYVHPQQKRSSLVLSPKSLELCTENLGSESGTDIVENGIEMLSSIPSSNSGGGNLGTREQSQRQPCQLLATKKAKTLNFPPPLTTIRGSESLRVRPHREDGRLVIEVTKVPPTASCFQAERSHGRLRLCFSTTSFDPEEEEEEEDVVDESDPTPNEGFDEIFSENEMNGQIQYAEEVEEEEQEEETEETEEEAEEEEAVACGDMRMEKYERRRRCNEGSEHENNEFLNWGEPLWVATS